MSDSIDRFRDAVAVTADPSAREAFKEVADALERYERRNLIVCELRKDPLRLVVAGARNPAQIAEITETAGATSDGAVRGAIADRTTRDRLLWSIEEQALELLRHSAPSTTKPPATVQPPDDATFPLSVKAVAARIVDLVIGAPLGTTPEDDIQWYSPAISQVYSRYRSMHGGTGGERIWINRETHDKILKEVQDRVARSDDGGEALRLKFAHTRKSGWDRGAGQTNVPLPRYKPNA